MSKVIDIHDFKNLSSAEKAALTRDVNFSRRVSPSGIGYIFINLDNGEEQFSPKTIDGVSGKDLLDYNIYFISIKLY